MKRDNNVYRLLIEGLKQEYLGRNPFVRCIDFPEGEPLIVENDSLDLIEKAFSITVTVLDDVQYKQIKKYEIVSKSDQKKWSLLLVPTGVLFVKNKFSLRKKLVEKYSIRGIVTLKNSFFGVYAMPVSVIILDEKARNVWLTSATCTDDILVIFSDISQYKRKVYYTDNLDPESFMPEFYNEVLNQINEKIEKYAPKELQEIAEIILGRNVERADFEKEGIPYLRVRNVQNGKICNLDSYVRSDCAVKYAKQLLQEGDLLLSKNFGQYKVARVNEEDLPAIASNGFFIIRAYGVPEDYLYQYFTSKTGKAILEKQLSSIEQGTVITSISKKDLMKLKVPIFDKATMIDIGNIEEISASELINNTPAYSILFSNEDKNGELSGLGLEMSIYQQFMQTGWKKEEVLLDNRSYSIQIKENVRWFPDIVLMDGNTKLAIVEAKSDFSLFTPVILMKLQYAIYNDDIPFVILATAGYFEVHGQGNNVIQKSTTAPAKVELLQLLAEKEEA